ncbi:hypothetical protein GLOTRDRAFT_126937 [Gloeophyllum trabeum ATCC 11539]|uniref:Uncharacterized protein n=1 Tax=Gloeophyllum trabeum (strain ATCC 11539 / FP-39264 / Madison 617) TaxID=670483 RepID=S7RYG5_GLOTA|nr:uncharacterized protein GLOTRDRAFT_126937 [Gloeophyllum trabeum ATCC 11539]EPQ58444.1 hypothetical protein GLOTRDRAFT_126937 [Gloeophyllum trabeum ATCC 11539]
MQSDSMPCLCSRSPLESGGSDYQIGPSTLGLGSLGDHASYARRTPDDILHDSLNQEQLQLHAVAAHSPHVTPSTTRYAFPFQAEMIVVPVGTLAETGLSSQDLPLRTSIPAELTAVYDVRPPQYEWTRQLLFLEDELPVTHSEDRMSTSTENTFVNESIIDGETVQCTPKFDYLNVAIPVGGLLVADEAFL